MSAASVRSAEGDGALNGARYLESLRDGREVWLGGERVADVTVHPAFAGVCRQMAAIYDLQHAPATREVMTFPLAGGRRASYSYHLTRSHDDLIRKRRNSEVWARESFGTFGRPSDYCAGVVLDWFDARDELEGLHRGFGQNVVAYHARAQASDLCLAHALHDPCMDKSLRPEQDPDRCVRIVAERDDGLVVRGARIMSTLAPVANEILVYPSYPLNEREREFAVWFATPVAWPGVKLLCREPFAPGRNTFDHPLSPRFDEPDAMVIFDDAVVPWERVFLAYEPRMAAPVSSSRHQGSGSARAMRWASYSSGVRFLARMDLLIGTAHLMAVTAGIGGRPEVQRELGELVIYRELYGGALRAAELECVATPGGLVAPRANPALRPWVPMISERLVQILEHVGTSSLVMTPAAADFEVPELRPYIDRYFRGHGVSAEERVRLCKLAWELTCDSFGGRQQLYERLHGGDPGVLVANAYREYDTAPAEAQVRRLLGL